MRRAVVTALLFASALPTMAADSAEPLDEDFLAYLAEFESADDDWTIVETPNTPVTSAKKASPPATPPSRPADAPKAANPAPTPASKP